MGFRSYPRGSGLSGGVPAHQMPIVATDVDWVMAFGSRAQRRRLQKSIKPKATGTARRKR